MFEAYRHDWQTSLNWQPSDLQLQQLEQLYQQVLEGNKTQNLTRITEVADFWEKHLWDSLRGILPQWQQPSLQVIDIGSGAGFPGLPMAIAQPTWQVSLLDSTQKKVRFITESITAIGLLNATPLLGRAETLNQEQSHQGKYDLAVVRAVAQVDICANYAIPFLKPQGWAVLYRGQWSQEELESLTITCDRLGAKISHIDQFHTPQSQSLRHCVYLVA